MVDVGLYLEGERGHQIRVLRSPKNRFGPTDETGLFEMSDRGLLPAGDLTNLFSTSGPDQPGAAVTPVVEGARPLLVEIQALVAFNPYPTPTRAATGFDFRRMAMLIAVLERRAGVRIRNQDVYVNVVGGLRIVDPGADLALCVAIASANNGFPVSRKAVFLGEVGLGGEVRPVKGTRTRLLEARRAGFTEAFLAVGEKSRSTDKVEGIKAHGISHLKELLDILK